MSAILMQNDIIYSPSRLVIYRPSYQIDVYMAEILPQQNIKTFITRTTEALVSEDVD